MSEKNYVSMEAKVCPVCGRKHNYDCGILLDRRLMKSLDPESVTGWGFCEEHDNLRKRGYVALVAIDPEKSGVKSNGSVKPEDAYRTGDIVHVRTSIFKEIFGNGPPAGGLVFCDQEVIEKLRPLATPEELHNTEKENEES